MKDRKGKQANDRIKKFADGKSLEGRALMLNKTKWQNRERVLV
jgi:hypothetical protein